jgi:hypothetical protein
MGESTQERSAAYIPKRISAWKTTFNMLSVSQTPLPPPARSMRT